MFGNLWFKGKVKTLLAHGVCFKQSADISGQSNILMEKMCLLC